MSTITELEEKVKELLDEIETLKREKKNEEFEYPFEYDEKYSVVYHNGDISVYDWTNHEMDKQTYSQGNAFKTKQEAERERDRRALLTRFKQFRDKCNGDWKPDWKDKVKAKYFIVFNHESSELLLKWYIDVQPFESFGCFKNREDAIRAIELFGDEIKRLFVEEEK